MSQVTLRTYPGCLSTVRHLEIDDTAPGISEGVSAGCVTVGLALSGNAVGKTVQELARMPEKEIAVLRSRATALLKDA